MYFLVDFCQDLKPILRVIKTIYVIFQWAIPILLIMFGVIDLGKAVIAGKEDEQKKAQSMLIKRAVYAILVFFLFILVNFIMNIVGGSGADGVDDNWATCWKTTQIVD